LTNLCLLMRSSLRTFQSDSFSVSATARSLAIASDWCVNQQSQTTRKQKPMFQILEICDWPWTRVRIISESAGNLIFSVIFRTLWQQVVVWWYVVGAHYNQYHIHYISCNIQIICSKKYVIIYLRFILPNVCFSEVQISPAMPLKISSCDSKGELVNLTFRGPCIVIYSYNKSQWDAQFLKFIC
jgi:hypothetical protein